MKMWPKNQQVLIVAFLGLCVYAAVEGSIELRVPPFSAFVNRLTNTTFGIVRGGINIFSRAVDRIVTTFGRVEDRLRELLEEFRRQIVRGIPELSIPILDPLHVDKIDFDIVHDAAGFNGTLEDVTVKHISKFVIDKESFTDLGKLNFKLDLNLSFPYLTIDGKYDLDGAVGNTFRVFGKGNFWLHLIDFKLAISTVIRFEYPHLRLTSLSIDIKLGKLENEFENLMNDPELSELLNKAISKMAPEALDLMWPDVKRPVEQEVRAYVNHILENTSVASIARRIFNIY